MKTGLPMQLIHRLADKAMEMFPADVTGRIKYLMAQQDTIRIYEKYFKDNPDHEQRSKE